MITARLPEPPRCRFPCALCGESPARYLPKKTKKHEARCERCWKQSRAAWCANYDARAAHQEFERVNGTENDPRRLVRKMLKPLEYRVSAARNALEAAELARDPVVAEKWVRFASTQFERIGELHAELRPILDEAPAQLDLGPSRKGLTLVRGGAA